MRKVIQIVLALAIIGLAYVLYEQIMSPLRFQKEMAAREASVIDRIKDIRSAQQAYKQAYQRYTPSFDTLINFVLNDSLEYERSIGSRDDSVAVARGLVRTEKFKVAVIDTVFKRRVTPEEVRQIRYIPYSDVATGQFKQFDLDAGALGTESGVTVQVFEAKARYKDFLGDMDKQEIINLEDDRITLSKYPGIKVGSMEQATNDAGNWE